MIKGKMKHQHLILSVGLNWRLFAIIWPLTWNVRGCPELLSCYMTYLVATVRKNNDDNWELQIQIQRQRQRLIWLQQWGSTMQWWYFNSIFRDLPANSYLLVDLQSSWRFWINVALASLFQRCSDNYDWGWHLVGSGVNQLLFFRVGCLWILGNRSNFKWFLIISIWKTSWINWTFWSG